MKTIARAMALLAAAAVSMTALSIAPAHAEEVPDSWGEPVFQDGFMSVIGRQDGRLPGRPGNQHVTTAYTTDEDVVVGSIVDWWCPTGVIAPSDYTAETSCQMKASANLSYEGPAEQVRKTWSPKLKYMTLRTPVVVRGNVVEQGNFSLRVRATGPLTLDVWDEFGDTSSWLSRSDAVVVGGNVLGVKWLDMTSVEVEGNGIAVYSYYNVPV